MGFGPTEVNAMSLWEFIAAFDGYQIANGIKPKPGGDIDEGRLRNMGIDGF